MIEKRDQMLGCALVVNSRIGIVPNPKVGASFKPEIVRQTGMDPRSIEILFG